jgi:hypothetical protein
LVDSIKSIREIQLEEERSTELEQKYFIQDSLQIQPEIFFLSKQLNRNLFRNYSYRKSSLDTMENYNPFYTSKNEFLITNTPNAFPTSQKKNNAASLRGQAVNVTQGNYRSLLRQSCLPVKRRMF